VPTESSPGQLSSCVLLPVLTSCIMYCRFCALCWVVCPTCLAAAACHTHNFLRALQHDGRLHSPMEDQENAGQQRHAAGKGGGPAARHGTSKAATGYAAGATRRPQRAPKAIKPQ
jgi:hypothetical protein